MSILYVEREREKKSYSSREHWVSHLMQNYFKFPPLFSSLSLFFFFSTKKLFLLPLRSGKRKIQVCQKWQRTANQLFVFYWERDMAEVTRDFANVVVVVVVKAEGKGLLRWNATHFCYTSNPILLLLDNLLFLISLTCRLLTT